MNISWSSEVINFNSNKYQYNGLIRVMEYEVDKINEKDLYEWCNPIVIEKKKLKVNYRYDICKFLKDTQL